jgi:tetratricopeptide (TPR) repeat protein
MLDREFMMRVSGRNLHQAAVFLLLILLCGFLSAAPARCQSNTGEGMEFRGNGAEISVTVRDSNGQPIAVPAIVKLYRNGAPFDQGQTSKGHIFFILHALGEFNLTVEAAGYKAAQKDVSVQVAARIEVDLNLQSDTPSNFTSGAAGPTVLAPKAREALDKGLQAIRDDKLDDAERALGQAMKLAPSNAEVLYAQGVLDLKRRDWLKAQSVLEKADQVDPNHARTLAALGMALCNQKKYEEAIVPLEKALQLDPASGWETHWSLAESYYRTGKYEEALKTAKLAQTEANGQAPQIDLLVAQALTAEGRFDDAAQVLRDLLKSHPDGTEAATAKRFLDRLTADGKIRKQ